MNLKIAICIAIFLLSSVCVSSGKPDVNNKEVGRLASELFGGFHLIMTDIKIEEGKDSLYQLSADYTWELPGFSYNAYKTYLQELNKTLRAGKWDYDFSINLERKEFPDAPAEVPDIPMVIPEKNFIGKHLLDCHANSGTVRTPKFSIFSFEKKYKGGKTETEDVTGCLGSVRNINLMRAGGKADFLDLRQRKQLMNFDFNGENAPRLTFIMRGLGKNDIKNLEKLVLRLDKKRNFNLAKAWIQNPNQTLDYLATLSRVADKFDQETVTARAKAKLRVYKTEKEKQKLFSEILSFFLFMTIPGAIYTFSTYRRYGEIDGQK